MTKKRSIRNSFQNNLLTGMLVLSPIGASLWALVWVWGFVISATDLIPEALHPKNFLHIENPFASLALDFFFTVFTLFLLVAFVSATGLISRNYFGDRFLRRIRGFFGRIPVIKTIYSTLEQLLKTFTSGQSKNFRRVVWIEFPRKGSYTLALVTGDRSEHPVTKEVGAFLNIYVPTTPNPTSGYYLIVRADETSEAKITVEQALKEIISMGIVKKEP